MVSNVGYRPFLSLSSANIRDVGAGHPGEDDIGGLVLVGRVSSIPWFQELNYDSLRVLQGSSRSHTSHLEASPTRGVSLLLSLSVPPYVHLLGRHRYKLNGRSIGR